MTTIHECKKLYGSIDIIERRDNQWVFEHSHYEVPTSIEGDEEFGIDEYFTEHPVAINFCPFCGEQLNPDCEPPSGKHHKRNIPSNRYYPENFYQCPPLRVQNTTHPNEIWTVVKFFSSSFKLEKYVFENDDFWFKFRFEIVYCPFCGEPLNMHDAHNLPRE